MTKLVSLSFVSLFLYFLIFSFFSFFLFSHSFFSLLLSFLSFFLFSHFFFSLILILSFLSFSFFLFSLSFLSLFLFSHSFLSLFFLSISLTFLSISLSFYLTLPLLAVVLIIDARRRCNGFIFLRLNRNLLVLNTISLKSRFPLSLTPFLYETRLERPSIVPQSYTIYFAFIRAQHFHPEKS